ncbi:MAG: hypothetical protein ACEPOZ_15865 [Marinifilaceae bacterium]
MKKKFLIILSIFFSTLSVGENLQLTGIYLGKNLYVMNPFADSGIGFCVYEVTVNGQTTTDEINSSAFEIDLSQYDFKLGERLLINLKYKNGCIPNVINPEDIKPKSSFKILSTKVDPKGSLHWTTTGELGPMPFVVQQFRWNKWITVGEVEGLGNPSTNSYQLNVRPHSGENKFRIFQTDYTERPHYSDIIRYNSGSKRISFSPIKVKDAINFSAPTLYEIYDSFGNIVFKGFGGKVNLKELQAGNYYLNFDNQMSSFVKK